MRKGLTVLMSVCSLVIFVSSAFAGRMLMNRPQQRSAVKAHVEQQKQENKQFREGLKGTPSEEKQSAVIEHRNTQYGENKEFHQKIHDENMAYLKERLSQNQKLTDAQRAELIDSFQGQYQENMSFRDTQRQENVAFFEKIANDPNMTQEQKKDVLKQYMAQQKTENKDYRQKQHEEMKAGREKMKAQFKTQAQDTGVSVSSGLER